MHRARMFSAAAMKLADYSGGEQNWPRIALLTHGIELALKAFHHHSIEKGKPPGKEPSNHDLNGWYQLALRYGLKDESGVAENIEILNELHQSHYSRYPQHLTNVPDVSNVADTTLDHLIAAFTPSINPR